MNQSMVGTATAAHVLAGKTFTNVSGVGIAGTMANQGAWTNTPTAKGKVTIPAGYHSGGGYVDTSTVYTNAYNAGVVASKPSVINGSMQFAGNDDGTSNALTFPVSGYKTLTIVASNSTSGTRQAFINVGATSYTIGENETKTIDVSDYDSITIKTTMNDTSIRWSATYTLSP